jgi:hypothetical protein
LCALIRAAVARPARELRYRRPGGAFAFALRDFAVAAALATQLESPGAASTAAVYGVLMLVAAATATELLRRQSRAAAGRRSQ